MANRVASADDWEDDESDDDWLPDDYTSEDDPTIPCPHCRTPIHVESQKCPNCGEYLSEEEAPPNRKPWWIVLGAILCLFAVYLWIRS